MDELKSALIFPLRVAMVGVFTSLTTALVWCNVENGVVVVFVAEGVV